MSPAASTQRTVSPSIRLRSDLKAFARTDGRVIIEDPVVGKHYRLGGPEYKFVVHLAHSGSALTAHDAIVEADPSWTQNSSQQLLSWLANRGLLKQGNAPLSDQSEYRRRSRQPNDPLFFRLSFGSPESWTSALARSLKPTFGPAFRWLATLLVVFAVIGFITQWPQFSTAYEHLLSRRGALTLVACGLLLKLLHELGHCVACNHFGGRVRDWGVLLICGAPLPFVDVSDSRRFPSRRPRLLVALAGVLTEAIVVALSVAGALIVDSPTTYYIAAHLVLTLGVSALLFNLNPLMKFDGYYVVADGLGIDNLYGRGAEFVRRLGARFFLGQRADADLRTPIWVQVYGLASFAWRTLAIAAIGCIAVQTLQGPGLLLVAWSAWRLWGRAAFELFWPPSSSVQRSEETSPIYPRLTRLAALLAVTLASLCCLPMPFKTTTYATVEYDPPSVVRSPANAFVVTVHVCDNQRVDQGDLLLTLRSDTLAERLATLEAACRRHEQRIRSARSRHDMQELKIAQSDLSSAKELRRQAADAIDSLRVRSPVAGVVTARHLAQLPGTYLAEGCEIAAIGREDAKRLRALANPDSCELFFKGQRLRYLTPAGDTGEATVAKVLPRATRQADRSPLAAHVGGPLEVSIDDFGKAEFSESHTPVLAELDRQQSFKARVGQRVAVSIGGRRTIAGWLWDKVWRRT